ncbi:helix-turn-helix domain-containing protein [Nocardia sp. 004]|uniref:helix-turn-helix domain-containing protein n=1 Tax=Nocardia sp. 004 TaxID=3385978 RepID=UPI0039A3B60B
MLKAQTHQIPPENPTASADTDHTPVGHILRDYRREIGLTQGALARKSELSTSLISKIEVCQRAVNSDTIAKIAPALGLNALSQERLIRLIDPHLQKLSTAPPTLTRRELNLLDNISHPACYLTPGLKVVVAANTAFSSAYPGLQVGESLVEWHLFSPWAKAVLPEWENETHLWVRACREALTGFVPISDIEAIKTRLRRHPSFDEMWNTRAAETVVTREILRISDPGSGKIREMLFHLSRDERCLMLTPPESTPNDDIPPHCDSSDRYLSGASSS